MADESQPHLKLELLFLLVKLVKNVNEIPFNIRRIVMRHPEGIQRASTAPIWNRGGSRHRVLAYRISKFVVRPGIVIR